MKNVFTLTMRKDEALRVTLLMLQRNETQKSPGCVTILLQLSD